MHESLFQVACRFFFILAGTFYYFIQSTLSEIRPRYLESVEESLNDTAHLLAAFLESSLYHPSEADESNRSLNQADLRNISTRLEDASLSLERMMERARSRRFEAKIYDIVKERMNLYVYVTNHKGIVLYDSSGLRTGEDLSRMNDVYLTLRGKYGARSSRMVEEDPQTGALYVAAPIRYGQNIVGVLTVVKPKDSVTPFIELARQRSLMAGLLTACAIFLFAGLIFLWVSLPVRKLSQYVSDLRKGKRVELPALGKTEIGELGRALEDLRKELEGKDYVEKYIQTLNHEIKSPLTALKSSVELLEEDLPPARRKRLVGNIQRETQRIQSMIERMLDLSIVENQNRISRQDIDLKLLLEDQIESLQTSGIRVVRDSSTKPTTELPQNENPQAGDDGMAHSGRSSELSGDSAEKGPVFRIRGDSFLLGRAISNLLRNALEFREPGSAVECEIYPSDGALELAVKNRGPLIPDYAREKIFQRFYSLPRPETGSKSTGLGLPFVREVMELHGGEVSIENLSDGTGVRAVLRIPTLERI